MQGTLAAVGRTKSSFPNLLEKLVLMTGHLTPSLLEGEIAKMSRPQEMIFIMHLKPQFLQEIETERCFTYEDLRGRTRNDPPPQVYLSVTPPATGAFIDRYY
jgi:hypothetical protein